MAQKKRSKRRSRLLILPFTKRNIYDQTRELGGAFEHNFGPKGREYERTILQKFMFWGGEGRGCWSFELIGALWIRNRMQPVWTCWFINVWLYDLPCESFLRYTSWEVRDTVWNRQNENNDNNKSTSNNKMKRKQWHPIGAKMCTDICARTLKNWFMLSVRLFLLGPVYMEVGDPR